MDEKAKILFVDDEKEILIALRALFRSQYQVFVADSGDAALDILGRETIHVLVSDQRMPKMLGHELLREARKISPQTIRLLLTGYSDLGAIMHSINDGEIFRFIHKPWDNTEIRATLENAVKISLDTAEAAVLLAEETADDELVGEQQDAGILVLDDTTDSFHKVQGMYRKGRMVHHATSIDEALENLERTEVAVLLTDVMVDGEDTTEFLKLLKQQYPMIMTIVLAEALDSDSAVSLINQARVYRYHGKSVPDELLRRSIAHGLRFYQTNQENPQLLQQQQVEAVPVIQNPSLAQRMKGRFKALRERFRWFF